MAFFGNILRTALLTAERIMAPAGVAGRAAGTLTEAIRYIREKLGNGNPSTVNRDDARNAASKAQRAIAAAQRMQANPTGTERRTRHPVDDGIKLLNNQETYLYRTIVVTGPGRGDRIAVPVRSNTPMTFEEVERQAMGMLPNEPNTVAGYEGEAPYGRFPQGSLQVIVIAAYRSG